MLDVFLAAERCVTWFLAGLVWFVQLVHYPSFGAWNPATFALQHGRHTRSTGFIVAPFMVTELVLSILTAFRPPQVWKEFSQERAFLALGMVGVVWAVTFSVMVPLHNRLSNGFDASACKALVRWNWCRTVAWSLRALLLA